MSSTSNDISSYHRDGYVHLGQILSEAECKVIRSAITDWVGPNPEQNIYGILRNNCWQEIPILKEMLYKHSLGAYAATLVGKKSITLFQDNLIWKPPQTTQSVEWHQDYAYWPLNTPNGTTFWIAIDDTDIENGCIHLIPETHNLGERAATNFTEPGVAVWSDTLPPIDWKNRQQHIKAVPMKAGEIVAFHPLLWHMSPPNHSTRNRRGWSLSWITDDVLWDPEHAPHPFCYWLQVQKGDTIQGTQFLRFAQ